LEEVSNLPIKEERTYTIPFFMANNYESLESARERYRQRGAEGSFFILEDLLDSNNLVIN
jgi:hypothetical protein